MRISGYVLPCSAVALPEGERSIVLRSIFCVLFFGVLLFFLPHTAFAQTWARTYGGASEEHVKSIQQTADGSFVMAGYTQSFGAGGYDFWVLKLDALGNVQWEKAYGGTSWDRANSIQQTTDGGYIVTGYTESFGAGNRDFWVLKLDASGNVSWQKTYGGISSEYPDSIQQTSDGGYIVGGNTYSFGAGNDDFLVLKLDASGNVSWQKTYGGAFQDSAESIQQTADGGFIVAGATSSFGAGGLDFWVLKLDASGNVQWQKTYGGALIDSAESIQQTTDGGFVVAGVTESFGAGWYDFWVLKLDTSGNVAWQKTYGGTSEDIAYSIRQTTYGDYVVAGVTDSFGAGWDDFWVLKLDASGNVTWQKTYGGASGDFAWSVQPTSDGGYVVTGETFSFGAGTYDSWALKLDANGEIDASCTFIADTAVTGVDSGAVPANTAVSAVNSAASISNTAVAGVDSAATVAEQCYGCTNDAYEPDNNCFVSDTTIHDAETFSLNFCNDTEDWLSFNACVGRSYTIETSNLGPLADTVLELYGTDCSSLLDSDDNGGGGNASLINWTAPADGTYHLKVLQFDATTGKDRDYDITLTGDTSPCATWARAYGGAGGYDFANSIQQTADGGYVVAGQTDSFGAGSWDFWVLKLNASGNVSWQKSYGGASNDVAYSIQQTTDGGYAVAGRTNSFSVGSSDLWLLKLDNAGNVQWQKAYGETLFDFIISIQQAVDGGYIVAGRTNSFGAGIRSFWILKLGASGNVEWEKTYGGNGGDFAWSVQQASDGGFVVAGYTQSFGAGSVDFWVLKLDALGNVTWQKTYGGIAVDSALSLQQTSDGGYVVAGETNSFGAGFDDVWVLKLDALGNVEWQKTYGGAANDVACSVQQTTDGGFVVAGYTWSFGAGGDDFWVLKLDTLGTVQWQKTYGGAFSDGASFVQHISDGGFVVAGWTGTFGSGGDDVWVLKLDANGNIDATCTFIGDTAVTGAGTMATVTFPGASGVATSAAITDTGASGVVSSATVQEQCTDCPALSVSAGVDSAAVCLGTPQVYTATPSDGVLPFTYEWDFSYDSVTFNVEGAGNPVSYTQPAVGSYTVRVRVTDSCAFGLQIAEADVPVTVNPPAVAYDTSFDSVATLAETCGDGDLLAEPGEEWQVTVQLINAACAANNVRADLTVNAASLVAAAVCNNPGYYGDMPGGGTSQFTYSFIVDTGAVCVNDITFDVTNIVSNEAAYASEIPAFAVQVGDTNVGATETSIQATDPLMAQNGTEISDFAPAFTIPGAAKSATLSYTLSGGTDLVACVEVALIDPFATATVVKPLGVADANPYDVTGLYTGLGTYQLRLMEDGKGCGGNGKAKAAAGTLSVTAPDVTECDVSACACSCPALSCTAGVDAATVCFGTAQTFTATPSGGIAPYAYEWDFSYDGVTFNVEGAGNTIVYTQPAAGSYTVAARVTDSCAVGAQTTICAVPTTVNAIPGVTTLGPTETCEGSCVTLTAIPFGGTPPFDILWCTGETTQSITLCPPVGVTNCTVTVTDTNGCSASSSETVTVNASPAADILPDAPVRCAADPCTALDANPSGGTPLYTYLWSTGATARTICVSPAVTTTYDVTVTDASGCSASSSETVTVNANPASDILPDAPARCAADPCTALDANPSGGTPPYTYLWSTGATARTICVSPAVTTTYDVTVTDASGCSAWSGETVTVNANPASDILPDAPVRCAADPCTALDANPSGGTPPYTYLWSTGATSQTICVSPAATTTYDVTVTDASGCSASSSETVTVNANPTPEIGESACSGVNVTLDAGAGYASYLWNTGATTQTITVAGDGSSYDVTVTDAVSGCPGSDSHATTNCGALTWARTYGGVSWDQLDFVQQTADGGYIVAGYTYSFGAGNAVLWVLKLDSSGNVSWQKTYGGTNLDVAYSVQQTSDGGFVVAGRTESFGAGGYDLWVLKLDVSGNVEWQKTYGDAGTDIAYSIQQTTDGGFIVAGAGSTDFWVLKLDASGNVQWQKNYGGFLSDKAYSIEQTTDGGFVIAGQTNSFGAGGSDFWVFKLDALGNVTWQKTFGGASSDQAYSIQQTLDGGYAVAGYTTSFGAGGYEFWILKLDALGNVTWQKTYGGASNDIARSIQQTTDGGYAVVGYTESFGAGSYDFWVLKLDALGNVSWQKTYGNAPTDYATSIQQTSDGGFVVAGYTNSFGAGSYDYWVLKLDANGKIDASCTFISDTTVTGVNSSATVITTTATGLNTAITPTNTAVAGIISAAVVDEQCARPVPFLTYSADAFTDCGNADGFVDPGETIDLNVTAQNTGGADAFIVSGVLSTVTPGITITANTAAFPDIPAGLTGASLTPFQFIVDVGVPCGTLIDFTLDLTYTDAALNPFSNAEPFQVQVSAGGPVTFLSEDFNLGLPGTWTVIDGGNGPDTWTDADPCARGLFPDTYMIADSDCALLGAIQDEELITPLIDASSASAVTLRFDHDFLGFALDGANDDFATVSVRSALTGGAWTDLIQWDENDSSAGTITLDATAECAGAADCQFGWRYEGAYDWYWGVDNVTVDGIAGCSPATCGGPLCAEPSATDISPAVPPLMVGTTGVVAVEELACATGYVVYENALGTWYGTPGRVCVSPASPNGDGTVTLTGYSVPVDSWIVVASADASGESSCGRDSAGAERNTMPGWPATGPCP